MTAFIEVCQTTPYSAASWATGGRACLPADLPAGLRTRPFRHRVAGPGDIITPFGPGLGRADQLVATPHPLGPHQPGRPTGDRQIAQLHGAPVVGGGEHAAVRSAGPCCGGLHGEPDLAINQRRSAQRESIQAEHDSAQRRIVHHP